MLTPKKVSEKKKELTITKMMMVSFHYDVLKAKIKSGKKSDRSSRVENKDLKSKFTYDLK